MDSQLANLDTFVGQLVEEKGLNYLEAETLAQVKKDLIDRLENRINALILANLPPQYLEEFEKKLDDKMSDEEMQKYCADKIPNLPELIAAELLAFRQTYING